MSKSHDEQMKCTADVQAFQPILLFLRKKLNSGDTKKARSIQIFFSLDFTKIRKKLWKSNLVFFSFSQLKKRKNSGQNQKTRHCDDAQLKGSQIRSSREWKKKHKNKCKHPYTEQKKKIPRENRREKKIVKLKMNWYVISWIIWINQEPR
jgi:hypothetical protein